MCTGSPISFTLSYSPSFKSQVATASTPVHGNLVDTPFSRDYLGAFIEAPSIEAPNKGDVLKHANISEKKQDDPFVKPLVENRSPAVCQLTLSMGGPSTLAIARTLSKKETQSSALALFNATFSRLRSSPAKDKVLNALERMSASLDKAYRGDIHNANGLEPASRERDFKVYKKIQHLIRETHSAYLREKNQTHSGPTASYMNGYIPGRLGANSENVEDYVFVEPENLESAKTFRQAWEELGDYVNHEIKLDTVPKENKRILSVFTLVYRASLIDPSKITSGLVALLQCFFENKKLYEINQVAKENAFRTTLQTKLNSVINEVKMDAAGGISAKQFDTNMGYVHGAVDSMRSELVTREEITSIVESAVENTVKKAVNQLLIQRRSSTDSFVSIPENLTIGQPIRSGSNSPAEGNRASSPELDELKQALADVTGKFADVSEENKTLHKKVEALESGQQQMLEMQKVQNALLERFLASQQK